MSEADIRHLIEQNFASMHRRFEDRVRHDDTWRGEVIDRLDRINGRVGSAHERAAILETRVAGLEDREDGDGSDGTIHFKELRVWVLIIASSIGGTLAFLRFIGKL